MTGDAASGVVSRRGFLLALAAVCLAGRRKSVSFKRLDDASVRQMALWSG